MWNPLKDITLVLNVRAMRMIGVELQVTPDIGREADFQGHSIIPDSGTIITFRALNCSWFPPKSFLRESNLILLLKIPNSIFSFLLNTVVYEQLKW